MHPLLFWLLYSKFVSHTFVAFIGKSFKDFILASLFFFSSTNCLQVLAFTIGAEEASSYFVENILDTLEYEYLFPALLQTQMSFELHASRQANPSVGVFMLQ